MSIQRFEGATAPDGNGRYVLYADHVAAMEDQVKSVNMAAMKAYAYLALTGNKDAAEKISQIILEAGR